MKFFKDKLTYFSVLTMAGLFAAQIYAAPGDKTEVGSVSSPRHKRLSSATLDYNRITTNKPTLGTAAAKNIPAAGNASATEVVYGTDSRLTDPRTPTAHNHAESEVTNLTTDLAGKVTANGAITGATKTKITYDSKGLVTSGADATTADIAESTDKNYVTDAQKTVLGNTSGVNTGDQDLSALATKTELNNKQDTLVSGTNIKTVNGVSVLGSGDLTVNAAAHAATHLTTGNDPIQLANETTDGLMPSAVYNSVSSFVGATATSTYSVNEGAIGDGYWHPLTDSVAGPRWTFNSSTEGWTGANATLTQSSGKLIVTATSADSSFSNSTVIPVPGSKYKTLKIYVKRTAGSGWDGSVYYSTAAHSWSGSYKKIATDPTGGVVGNEGEIVLDMSTIDDFVNNNITGLRIDLGSNTVTGDNFEIDYIKLTDDTTTVSYTAAAACTKWPYLTANGQIKSSTNACIITDGNIANYGVDWCAVQNGVNKAGQMTGRFFISKGTHVLENTVTIATGYMSIEGIGEEGQNADQNKWLHYGSGTASNLMLKDGVGAINLFWIKAGVNDVTIRRLGMIEPTTLLATAVRVGDDDMHPRNQLGSGTLSYVNDTTLSLSNDYNAPSAGFSALVRFKDSTGQYCQRAITTKTGTGPYTISLALGLWLGDTNNRRSNCNNPSANTPYIIIDGKRNQNSYELQDNYNYSSRNIIIEDNFFYRFNYGINSSHGITFMYQRNTMVDTHKGINVTPPQDATHTEDGTRIIRYNEIGGWNTALDGSSYGIRTAGVNGISISNNHINNRQKCVWLNQFELGENMNLPYPLSSSSQKVGFINISDNNFGECSPWVQVEASYIITISNNIGWTNFVTAPPIVGGIEIYNSAYVTVAGNQLASPAGPGVYFINDKSSSPPITGLHSNGGAARGYISLDNVGSGFGYLKGITAADNNIYRHTGYMSIGSDANADLRAAVYVLTNALDTTYGTIDNNSSIEVAGGVTVNKSYAVDNTTYYSSTIPSSTPYTILNGKMGLGTTVPTTELEVASTVTSDGARGITSSQFSADAYGAIIRGLKARGTIASPVKPSVGDVLLKIEANGYVNGTQKFKPAGSMNFVTTASDGSTNPGAYWNLLLDNGFNDYKERVRVTDLGKMGIGTTTPQVGLDIYASFAGVSSRLMARDDVTNAIAGGGFQLFHNNAKSGNNFVGPANGDRLGWIGYGSAAGTEATATMINSALISSFTTEKWTHNTYCTGSGQPDACCTGNGAGTCGALGSEIRLETTNNGGITRSVKAVLTHDGKFGIGTATPQETLDITGTTVSTRFKASNGYWIPTLAGTSIASPTIVANNAYWGAWVPYAYDGGAYINRGYISPAIDGTPSSGNMPIRWEFATGSTSQLVRMAIKANGNIQTQTNTSQMSGSKALTDNTPTAFLKVDLASNTGTALFCKYTIKVGDGTTDAGYHSGRVTCNLHNVAGTTYTTSNCSEVGEKISDSIVGTAVTLPNDAFTVTNSSGNAIINLQADFTDLKAASLRYDCEALDPVALTPQ